MIMFFPSTYPSSRKPWRNASAWVDSEDDERADRYPIRGTFFVCCALAITPTASSTTTNRIDTAPAFFIAHTIRYVSRGAVLEETEIDDRRRQELSSEKTRF